MGPTRPRLRVTVIGAGMIGRAHTHAFRSLQEFFQPPPAELELAVVADADPVLARDAQQRFGFERIAASWEEVVDAGDVDLAAVVLPNQHHWAAVEALAASGKHLRRAGVVHATGFNLQRTPAIAAIQRAIARGDFGEVRHFSGRYLTDYAASPEVPFTWCYERALAGAGALADIGSHLIDLARFLLGEIDRVQGGTLETFIHQRPIPAGHVIGHARTETTGELRDVDTDDVVSFTACFRFHLGAHR